MLALTWAALTGSFTPGNLSLGFGIGFLVLYFSRRVVGSPAYGRKVVLVIELILFFLWSLLLSNLRVAYEVLTPRHGMRPGVIAIPLDARTDSEITLLANMITLTPGTLSLDIAQDRDELYIHAMYVDDPDRVRREIKDGFERRVLEVLR